MPELFGLPAGRFIKLAIIAYNAGLLFMLFLLFLRKDILRAKGRSAGGVYVGIFLVLSLLFVQYTLAGYAQYIEPNWIQVETIAVKNPVFSEAVRGLKIVHISDPHIKRSGFREQDMVRKINAIAPDFIFITGDFITERKYIPVLKKVMAQLKVKLGIYGVLGDNDFYAVTDILELKIALDNAGVRILDNESAYVPLNEKEGIWIIGLTNQRLSQDIIRQAYKGVKLSEPKIVLTHYPKTVDSGYLAPENTDLVLSGGTHGGQVGFAFVREFFDTTGELKYAAGLYRVNEIPLYVNRGIGAVGDMQADTIRFFCRPEITLIKLMKE